MTLIEALEKEAIPEIAEPLESVIETALSKVFIYKTIVRKVYKHESNFIGDFADFNFRKDFYADDFAWNQAMSPLVYRSLKALKMKDGVWTYCSDSSAEDYLIEMNRIDTKHDMVNVALEGRLTDKMILNTWNDLSARVIIITEQQRSKLPSFQSTWSELFNRRLDEMPPWCQMSDDPVLISEVGDILSKIRVVLDYPYMKNFDNRLLEAQIDNQACNIIFEGEKAIFIDIFLMKEFWRVGDPFLGMSRMAVDVAVLAGAGREKILEEAARRQLWILPERVHWAYMVYSALIMAPLFHLLKKPDIAQKYIDFIHANVDKIQ